MDFTSISKNHTSISQGEKIDMQYISAFKMPDVPALCLLLLTTKLSLNALQVEVFESEHC